MPAGSRKTRTMNPHSTSMEIPPCVTPTASRLPSPSAPSTARDQALSLDLELQMALPMPRPGRASPRPDRGVRPSGRSRSPAPALPGPHREGRPGTGPPAAPRQRRRGIQRRGTRPFTFKTTFGEVTVRRSRIRHNRDGSMEIPSATAWDTPHQLAITQNLRDAVCDQMSDRSAGEEPRRHRPGRRRRGPAGAQHDPRDRASGRRATDRRPTPARPGDPGRRVRGPTGLARLARGRGRAGRAQRRPAVRRSRGGAGRVGTGPGRVDRDRLPRV